MPNRSRLLIAPLALAAMLAGPARAQERTVGLLYADSAAFVGYTLFAPMPYNVSYLIDNEGRKVNEWQGNYRPGASVSLLENGLLLRTCALGNSRFNGGGSGGQVELVDWDGDVVWAHTYSNTLHCQHHDAIGLPNGNILLLAWEYKNRQQCLDAGRSPNLLFANSLWPDHLIEVSTMTDSVVWEWHIWDHLVQAYDSTRANYGIIADHPELVNLNYVNGQSIADWNHCNSLAYNPELDQVILSSRQFSEIWVIDHSTTTVQARGHSGGRYGKGGDILYRWGNPRIYGRGTSADQTFFGQHDVHWIADGLPGAGRMLAFNNGLGRPTPAWTSIDEIIPPTDSAGFYHLGADSAYGPTGPTWSWSAPVPRDFYASLISGCQRQPNGNTLVCNGVTGTFFEIDTAGEVCWKYVNPVTAQGPLYQYETVPLNANQVFKVRRYPPGYSGFNGRSLVPGDPVELYPQAVSAPARPTGPVLSLAVNPNPVSGRATADFTTREPGPHSLALFDAQGRQVAELACGWLAAGHHSVRWDARGLAPGTYFAVLSSGRGTRRTRFTVAH